MNAWFIIGILLIIWVIYDLIVGEVWLHKAYYKDSEPVMYWVLIIIWFIIALWCLSYWWA